MVPRPVADEIDGLRRALASAELTRIAPHITLAPPANVREEEVEAACELVEDVAADFGPLALELGPVTSFLPSNPVCYLAVGGEGAAAEALGALARRLRTGPLAPPAGRAERPFVPHVTIKQRMVPERIPAAVAALEAYGASVVFEAVTLLVHSESERRWNSLLEVPFGGPAIVGRGGVELVLSVTDRLGPAVADWSRRAWQQYARVQYGPGTVPDRPFAITARTTGTIAGVAEGEVRGITCRLARLIVAPDRRGSGVGTQLLKATERHAGENGCERVRLEVMAGGRAEGFYRGRGYVVTATLPRWRGERDFVVMERVV